MAVSAYFGKKANTNAGYLSSSNLVGSCNPLFIGDCRIIESTYPFDFHGTSLSHIISHNRTQVFHHRIRITACDSRTDGQFISNFIGCHRLSYGNSFWIQIIHFLLSSLKKCHNNKI